MSANFPYLASTGRSLAESSKPTVLTFPISSSGRSLNLNVPTATKTTTLGQKKLLLATKNADPRVSIRTSHGIVSGVSARMLAAFSGFFKKNLSNVKSQEIYLPTVQKLPLVTLVGWMVNTCALSHVPSFYLANVDVPNLKLLWDTAENLDMKLAKQTLEDQLGVYTRYCSPVEFVELFAAFAQSNHTTAIVALNRSLRPYMVHRTPRQAVQLWKEAFSPAVSDIFASKSLLIPRLPGEFSRYLESRNLAELLQVWAALMLEQGLEQPQKQTNYHLNAWVHNRELSVKELEQVFLTDATTPWTKVAIRRTALRLWWNHEADEEVNDELTPLPDALKAELDAIWDEQNQRWEERQAKSRADRQQAAMKRKAPSKPIEDLDSSFRTLRLGDYMKGSKSTRPTL